MGGGYLEGEGEGGGSLDFEGEGKKGVEGGGNGDRDGDEEDGIEVEGRQDEDGVALPIELSLEDHLEEDLNASDKSVVQQARRETRAAKICDTTGLSPEEAKKDL